MNFQSFIVNAMWFGHGVIKYATNIASYIKTCVYVACEKMRTAIHNCTIVKPHKKCLIKNCNNVRLINAWICETHWTSFSKSIVAANYCVKCNCEKQYSLQYSNFDTKIFNDVEPTQNNKINDYTNTQLLRDGQSTFVCDDCAPHCENCYQPINAHKSFVQDKFVCHKDLSCSPPISYMARNC